MKKVTSISGSVQDTAAVKGNEKIRSAYDSIDAIHTDTAIAGSAVRVLGEALQNMVNQEKFDCVVDCTFMCDYLSEKIDKLLSDIEGAMIALTEAIQEGEGIHDTVGK